MERGGQLKLVRGNKNGVEHFHKPFLCSSSRLRQQSDEYHMQSVAHELLLGDRHTDGRTDGRSFLNELRVRALAPGEARISYESN